MSGNVVNGLRVLNEKTKAVEVSAVPEPSAGKRKSRTKKRTWFSIRVNLPRKKGHGRDGRGQPTDLPAFKTAGKRSGLGVTAYAVLLLEVNAELAKCQKMTDQELSRQMLDEFPHRIDMETGSVARLAKGKITFGYYRTLYNMGHLTKLKPTTRSVAYSEGGDPINPRRGRPFAWQRAGLDQRQTVGEYMEDRLQAMKENE
jgi:hypothetical protein